MRPLPSAPADYTPWPIKDFGYGIIDRWATSQVPPGAAVTSFDADYDARNIGNRRGFKSVLENGPGAALVSDFETDETWTGGAAETGADNFVLVEAAADGTQSRKLTATGGAAEVVMTRAGAFDLGTDLLQVIHLWLKTLQKDAGITGYTATLRFTTSGGNHYQVTLAAHTDLNNELEVGRGKYHRFRRPEFDMTGAPDWTNITEIRIALSATGTGTLIVAFDNLHTTPGLMQDLFQFRRQSGTYAGAMDDFAITNGVLYKNDGRRWAQVFSGFDPEMPVFSITTQNRRVLSDGKTSPRILMEDGATVYRLGIVAPPKQAVATQIAGGNLPDGKYFVQVQYYSSKTGTFSAPDDKAPKDPLITIAAGGGTAGIRFTNIPVSADAQVDWVLIGIRHEDEPELFFRITDGLNGDVANGTTTVDFNGSLLDLQARSTTALDPDMDYPSVFNEAGAQIEAHPMFLAEAGGYILAVMAEQPTVVRWSRQREPGSWAVDDEQPLGENDSDPLTGIGTIASTIFAFKRTGVYFGRAVGGDERIEFEDQISDRGAVEHKGIIKVGHRLFYRGQEGLYYVDNYLIPVLITALAQDTWDDLWSSAGEGFGCAVVNRSRHQILHCGRRAGVMRNDIAWVTHYRTVQQTGAVRGRWPEWAPSLHRIPAEVATEVKAPGGDWEPWIGGKGQVWRLNFGYEDDGRPVQTIHRTSLWSPNEHYVHIFRHLDIEAEASGAFTFDIGCLMGSAINLDATVKAPLQGTADVLGSFVLGTDILGAPEYVHQKMNLPPKSVRYCQFEFTFRGRAALEITRASLWSKPVGRHRPTQ